VKYICQLSKETLICTELIVKDYKEILKCSYGEEPNKKIFVETICEVLGRIVQKPATYIRTLNIIDVFCLLLDIRFNSLGACNVTLTRDEQKYNLELNLGYIKEETEQLFSKLSTTIEHNGIEIVFECPSVERLLQSTKEDYLTYIKGSYITKNDTKKFIAINTNEQAELLFDKISPKISLEIIQKFNTFVETITGMNFLSRYGFKDQQLVFVPSLDSLIWFTKLMFNEDLSSVYENIFYLGYTGRMGAEYVENSAVGEYNYYIALLRQVVAAKNSSNTPSENPQEADPEDPGLFDEDM
jgi:hypothetical protein